LVVGKQIYNTYVYRCTRSKYTNTQINYRVPISMKRIGRYLPNTYYIIIILCAHWMYAIFLFQKNVCSQQFSYNINYMVNYIILCIFFFFFLWNRTGEEKINIVLRNLIVGVTLSFCEKYVCSLLHDELLLIINITRVHIVGQKFAWKMSMKDVRFTASFTSKDSIASHPSTDS